MYRRQMQTFAYAMGLILIFLVSILTNAGGIGGGAILIPIYTFIFDFTIGASIPLSKATIFSGAVVNILLSFNNRVKNHPS